jgi:hypothetical protein
MTNEIQDRKLQMQKSISIGKRHVICEEQAKVNTNTV